MTAFGKLIRTTAFRLTLVYLFLFALFAASLLGYFAWNTRRLITEQITTTVSAVGRVGLCHVTLDETMVLPPAEGTLASLRLLHAS